MKKFIVRFIYLFYYIRNLLDTNFFQYIVYVKRELNVNVLILISDSIYSVFKYNISLTDYFLFGFYKLSHFEKMSWAGTGCMYEYQLKKNPPEFRQDLEDKVRFTFIFQNFRTHDINICQELVKDCVLARKVYDERNSFVFKKAHGNCGRDVKFIRKEKCNFGTFQQFLLEYDLLEEEIIQHDRLNELSDSGVNTIRIITTKISDDEVEILGARLRITVGSKIDNMAAGNLAIPIDIQSGATYGKAVYSDIRKADVSVHPITGKGLSGFKIPDWQLCVNLATDLALFSRNESVGWDIAITKNGPTVIEGNHDWCKLLWQLPIKKGLKHKLK